MELSSKEIHPLIVGLEVYEMPVGSHCEEEY